ncbi:MAG: hypothetical protein Q9M10_00820, partial [Mariprofundaceae bacterium]|nr:hypothetical protein [Mariprofundaceae bacterium]
YQILLHGLRDLNLVDEQRGAEMLVMRLCHLKSLLEPNTNMKQHDAVVPSKCSTLPEKVILHASDTQTKGLQRIEKQTQKEQPLAVQEPSEPHNNTKETSSLPLQYSDWEAVITAYAHVNPPVTAILEQVQCESFTSEKIILALDVHQTKFLRAKERNAFQAWLKQDVVWGKKVGESKLESVSDIRQRRQQTAKEQRWQEAEQDEAVKMLVKDMDCRLIDVQTLPEKEANDGVDESL